MEGGPVSVGASFAARRSAARRGLAKPTTSRPSTQAPATAPAGARRAPSAPDLRTPEQIAADRAAQELARAALLAEAPDDIPDVSQDDPQSAPQQAAAPGGEDAADLSGAKGVVVLSLAGVGASSPHVMRVGAGPLHEWCATRPLGVRWSAGWWTDAGPLPAKAKPAPEGTPTATFALPQDAAGHWSVLHGQTVGPWAWILAVGLDGEVVGAFHAPTHRRAALLASLGAGQAGVPLEDDWTLTAGARFGGAQPVVEPSADPSVRLSDEDEAHGWDEPDWGDEYAHSPVGGWDGPTEF